MSQLGISSGKVLAIGGIHEKVAMTTAHYGILNNDAQAASILPLVDMSNVTDFDYMFYYHTKITTLPWFNTRSATSMGWTFCACASLKTIPTIDTSNVTNFHDMFYSCIALQNLPEIDMSSGTTFSGTFEGCKSLVNVPTSISYASMVGDSLHSTFCDCNNLKTIGDLNTSSVTYSAKTFAGCKSLTSIGSFDASNIYEFNSTFYNCTSLVSLGMFGSRRSIDLSTTGLGHDALVTVLENLGTAFNSAQTITLGSTKLALLSDSEKAIATNKGYALA